MLVRLGLRAGELASLRLEDVDWRCGEITVHGKGDRSERLPLPADVGQTIVAYELVQSGLPLGGLEGFLNAPALPRHPDQLGQGRQLGRVTPVVRQLVGGIVAPQQHPSMPCLLGGEVEYCPGVHPWAFRACTRRAAARRWRVNRGPRCRRGPGRQRWGSGERRPRPARIRGGVAPARCAVSGRCHTSHLC